METESKMLKKIKNNLKNVQTINPEDVVDNNIVDDDEEGDNPPPQELVDEVHKYIKLDNECRVLQDKLKKYKDSRKNVDNKILKLLEKYGEQQISVQDGKLTKNQYKSKGSLTEDILLASFKEEGFKEDKIKTMMERINKKKEDNSKYRVQLKRTYNKA
jgi:hypothetical protein